MPGTLLGLCGSLRAASLNRKLMHAAAASYAPDTFVEGDLRLPLYDGDLEAEGVPDAVTRLVDQIAAADAVIIATPEYNQSMPGVLKNALDWISRVPGGAWKDRPVALMSAAAGRAGGARSQYAVRLAMQPFNPRLLQQPEVLVGHAGQQFDDNGRLVTESYVKALDAQMATLRAEVARGPLPDNG